MPLAASCSGSQNLAPLGQYSFGRATKKPRIFIRGFFVVCHKQARIGCRLRQAVRVRRTLPPWGNTPSGAPQKSRGFLSVAFLLCVTSRLASVAACGKLFGFAEPCPLGAILLRARHKKAADFYPWLFCCVSQAGSHRLPLAASCSGSQNLAPLGQYSFGRAVKVRRHIVGKYLFKNR